MPSQPPDDVPHKAKAKVTPLRKTGPLKPIKGKGAFVRIGIDGDSFVIVTSDGKIERSKIEEK